jgi:hypothetical protein
MKTILNIYTYLSCLCLAGTSLFILMIFQRILMNGIVKYFPKVVYIDVIEVMTFAGLMLIQGIIVTLTYRLWKNHIKLETK